MIEGGGKSRGIDPQVRRDRRPGHRLRARRLRGTRAGRRIGRLPPPNGSSAISPGRAPKPSRSPLISPPSTARSASSSCCRTSRARRAAGPSGSCPSTSSPVTSSSRPRCLRREARSWPVASWCLQRSRPGSRGRPRERLLSRRCSRGARGAVAGSCSSSSSVGWCGCRFPWRHLGPSRKHRPPSAPFARYAAVGPTASPRRRSAGS